MARGKLADLVVLADDPLSINPDRLAGIAVTNVFKEGVPVPGK